MKALTLYQPWATLVITGAKRIETRSWATLHTRPILIHASARMDDRFISLLDDPHFRDAFAAAGYEWGHWSEAYGDLPFGAIIGRTTIDRCVQVNDVTTRSLDRSSAELAFGDFTPGRWMWFLRNTELLRTPVPCRGRQRLWNVPADIEQRLDLRDFQSVEVA